MERGSVPRSTEITRRGVAWGFLGVLFITTVTVIVIALILVYINANNETEEAIIRERSECVTTFDCNGGLVCEQQSRTCVECTENGNCPGTRPLCNTETFVCQGCLDDTDCPSNRPTCDEIIKTCIECTTAADCAFPDPICDPVSRTCVECASNSDCPSFNPFCTPQGCAECIQDSDCVVGECNGGICCDLTAPTIVNVLANPPPGQVLETDPIQIIGPRFVVNFSYAQPLSSLNGVILYISNDTDDLIITTPLQPVTGTLTFQSDVFNFPRLYYDFSYKFQIQIVTDCGPTGVSLPVNGTYQRPIPITPTTPSTPIQVRYPTITSGFVTFNGGGQPQTFELQVNNLRDLAFECGAFMYAYYSTNPSFEPNAGTLDGNTVVAECVLAPGDNSACVGTQTCRVVVQLSGFVSRGITYYVRVSNANPLFNVPPNYVTPVLAIPIPP